jgi:hypothetical protein
MVLEGVDASYDKPSVAELVAAGKRFFCGYVSVPGHAKNLTPAYVRDLQAAGLGVVVVGEISAGRALGGFAQGAADMRSWVAQVRDLGGPADGGVILMAIDFDVAGAVSTPATRSGRELAAVLEGAPPAARAAARAGDPDALAALGADGERVATLHAMVVAGQMGTVLDYLHGGASVTGHGRTGPYGERDVCTAAAAAGFGYLWQTYAWSGGEWEARAQLRQYRNGQPLGSGTVDLDRAIVDDYGQWKEDDVPLTEAEWTRLGALIDAKVKAHADRIYGLIYRGDVTEPENHPANLEQIRKEQSQDTADVLTAVKAIVPTLTDAQAELIGGRILAALQVGRLTGQVHVELGPE